MQSKHSDDISPLNSQEKDLDLHNQYILNVNQDLIRETSPLNVVRQVLPKTNTEDINHLINGQQPVATSITARTNKMPEMINSGRLNDTYSRTEDIDTVYIHSTMQKQENTANVSHRFTDHSPKTIQHNLHAL